MKVMKKQFNVIGMSCNHCRKSVEEALNSIDGVCATVTLDPAVAEVEFTKGEVPIEQLQRVIKEEAGDEYAISPAF